MKTGTYKLLIHQVQGPRVKQGERQKEWIRVALDSHMQIHVYPQEAQLGTLEYS